MHFIRKDAAILIGCFVLALILVAPAITHADEWNLATRFMVNQTTEVPGMVLQPNTRYVIRLFDSPSERHVAQIYNGDDTRLLDTFMCAADERATPTDRTVFTFIETEPGYPMPMKEWFYPGRIAGLEFIYPKEQARRIASHAREPILSADASDLHDLATLKVETTDLKYGEAPAATTAANFTKTENAPVVEEKPSAAAEPVPQETAPPAQNNAESNVNTATQPEVQREKPAEAPTAVPSTEPSTTEQTKELPRTAGELPLIASIGGLCLGAGLGLRVLSSKS